MPPSGPRRTGKRVGITRVVTTYAGASPLKARRKALRG